MSTVGVAIGLGLIASLATQVPAAAERAEQPRLMYVGDSITQGYPGDLTYRYYVNRELAAQSPNVRIVGYQNGPRYFGQRPELYGRNFNSAHAARSGSTYQWNQQGIGAWVEQYRPTHVVVALGFNDLSPSGLNKTANEVAADHQLMLSTIWSLNPEAKIVVGLPTLSRYSSSRRTEQTRRFGALVRKMWAHDKRVVVVDPQTRQPGARAWTGVRDAWGGIHPNNHGEVTLARHYLIGLRSAGLITKPAARIKVRPWRTDVPFTLKRVTKQHVRVSWDPEAVQTRYWGTRVELRIKSLKTGKVTVVENLKPTSSGVRVRAGRNEQHKFTIRVARKNMIGAWGNPKVI